MIKDGDSIETSGPTPCVFCAGMISIAEAAPGAVCHTLPMCDEFKRLEPGEFLDASIKRALAIAHSKTGHA